MKKSKLFILNGIAFILFTQPSFSQEVIAYPKKGQSAKQQEKDKFECYSWAKKQTGFDPQAAGTAGGATQGSSGGAVRGAGKGAAVGALGGAIGGDAGKGAAVGAGVGGASGGIKRRQAEKEQAQVQSKEQQKLVSFQKAEKACLQGRGYSVD
jgi:hypothetical protein